MRGMWLVMVISFGIYPLAHGTKIRALRPLSMVTQDIRRQIILNYAIYGTIVVLLMGLGTYLRPSWWAGIGLALMVAVLLVGFVITLRDARKVDVPSLDSDVEKLANGRKTKDRDVPEKAGWFAGLEDRAQSTFDKVVTIKLWMHLLLQWGVMLIAAVVLGLWLAIRSAMFKQAIEFEYASFLMIFMCGLIMLVPLLLAGRFMVWLALSGERAYFAARTWKPVALTVFIGPLCAVLVFGVIRLVGAVVADFDAYNAPITWAAAGIAMGYSLLFGMVVVAIELVLTIVQIKWSGWVFWALQILGFCVVGVAVAFISNGTEKSFELQDHGMTLLWGGVGAVVLFLAALWLWLRTAPRLDASKARVLDVLGVKA